MIDILIEILLWLVLSGCIASVTVFIEYIIGDPWKEDINEGAIFSFYGKWILKKHEEYANSIILNKPQGAHTKVNWYKALGCCPKCFNVHVAWILTLGIVLGSPLSWWGVFITIPISHIVLIWLMDKFFFE